MSIAKRLLEEAWEQEDAENAAYEDDYEAQFLDALERDDAKERKTRAHVGRVPQLSFKAADAEMHTAIWLSPICDSGTGRTWCQHDPGPCPECGAPSIKYLRADLVSIDKDNVWRKRRIYSGED